MFTVAKLLACTLVIGIGIYKLSIGEFGVLPTDGFDKSDVSYSSIALAFYSGLWSYDGMLNNTIKIQSVNQNFEQAGTI